MIWFYLTLYYFPKCDWETNAAHHLSVKGCDKHNYIPCQISVSTERLYCLYSPHCSSTTHTLHVFSLTLLDVCQVPACIVVKHRTAFVIQSRILYTYWYFCDVLVITMRVFESWWFMKRWQNVEMVCFWCFSLLSGEPTNLPSGWSSGWKEHLSFKTELDTNWHSEARCLVLLKEKKIKKFKLDEKPQHTRYYV